MGIRLLMQNNSSLFPDQHTNLDFPGFYAIVGPTASGKTALSLALAEYFKTDILCVDAMQVYQGLDIGTAKPTPEETSRVPHFGLDLIPPTRHFSASQYAEYGESIIQHYVSQKKPLVLCGGTGLYYRALLEGFFAAPDPEPDLRHRLKQQTEERGAETMHQILHDRDPQTAETIHPNDVRRVLRALEIIEQTGKTVTQFRAEQKKKPWIKFTYFVGIERNKKDLSQRIEKRAKWMYNNGLINETQSLIDMHCNDSHTALQALGYKECYDYLTNRCTLAEAIEKTILGTRRYAKRQMTWFRRQFPTHWIYWEPGGNFQKIVDTSLHVFMNGGNN